MATTNESVESNDLLDFKWDDSNEDFFETQEEKLEDKPEDGLKDDLKDDLEDTPPTKEASKKDAEEEEENDFEEFEKKEEVVEPEHSIYVDLYKDLKENGLFNHVEIEEGEDLDAEKFFELQQKEIETQISEKIKAWATEELDDDAQAFIKFKREGGATKDFFKTLEKISEIPVGSIDEEEYQDDVIRYQLSKEGWDRDEIEDRLEFLTKNGTKEKRASKYEEKMKQDVEREKQQTLSELEEEKKLNKKNEEDFKNSLKDTLDKSENIKGFKINTQDKSKLLNLLTKREHKVGNTTVTGFQKSLSEVFQQPDKLLLLAKLLDNDFDMSGFEKQVKTKHAREIKKGYIEQRKTYKNNPGSSLLDSLADFI